MPELPEVQTTVNGLAKKVRGRRIVGVWLDWPKMVKDPYDQSRTRIAHRHVAMFKKHLKGARIERVERRAKNILIYLEGDLLLLIHQKMTGHLLVGKWMIKKGKPIPLEPNLVASDPYNRYIHLILYLDNGAMVGLSDVRKFAKAILGRRAAIEQLPELANLGPEPLDVRLTFERFTEQIGAEQRAVKKVLMDPQVIAGIGNIYSDEILWRARIHPLTPAHEISIPGLRRLYQSMRLVLRDALKLRGTSASDYRDTEGARGGYGPLLKVYQRTGEKCGRCAHAIARITIGGRSAHYCPRCQKHSKSKK